MKILLTAFDPFGGEKINPAEKAVELVKSEDCELVKVVLPTVFNKSLEILYKTIESEKPDAVLCIGQAKGRSSLTPERVAINLNDARITDNEGNQPKDQKIIDDGENAYFSSLPIKEMVNAMRKENIPAEISNTAGTFVCNHVMYGLLHKIHTQYPEMIGGFMHVPCIDEQVISRPEVPSVSLETIVRGIEICLEVISK